MQCMTCQADIPPAWVNAIQKNECPGCGGSIMNDAAKELLVELRDAMLKMPNNVEGLAGWLLSNYDLFKKGTVEPTKFHSRPVHGGTGTAGYEHLKVADPAAQRFMKLSGADKIVQNPKAAALVAAINSAQHEGLYNGSSQAQEEEEGAEDDSPEEQMEVMKQAAAEAIKHGRRPSVKDLLSNNTTFNLGDGSAPLSEEDSADVQNMWGPGGDVSLPGDPPNIQADRMRRLIAQRELSYGGSIGKITRR